MAKPERSITRRLLDLQRTLTSDPSLSRPGESGKVIEALALIAEGVAKTARDLKELREEVNGGPKAKAAPGPRFLRSR